MSKLLALIFDVDGTLSDTERDGHRVAFNRAFAARGLDWNWSVERYGELLSVTGGKERMLYFCENYAPTLPETDDLIKTIANLHLEKNRYYADLLATGDIPLRPGVRRLLNEARDAGLRLGIATTTSPENVEALLETTLGDGSSGWFEVIAAGDCVEAKKPAPDIFELALKGMNLDPDACIAFEDSPNGLKSSLGAGLRTIVTVSGYTEGADFSGANLTLDQLGEPDSPFRVLAGDALATNMIDVNALYRFHDAWR